ncbi:MAG: hypothetical protein GY778_18560 [bacterium]|nr:hypothetical protein [bacterium]
MGSEPGQTGPSVVEYDIDFPVTGQYTLTTKYASIDARPTEVSLDGAASVEAAGGSVELIPYGNERSRAADAPKSRKAGDGE